jgi:hypothetical protein
MASTGANLELAQAAEDFTKSVKEFNGDPLVQMKLLKQAEKLRFMLETPMDKIMKQAEVVGNLTILSSHHS